VRKVADGSSIPRVLGWRTRLADFRGRGLYAGIPDSYRCIFIHIPKTAGSSIAESLFGVASRHVPYTEFLRANPKKFQRYFKFAFVRNPWDRLVSTFFFLQRGGLNELDRTWSQRNLAEFDGFEDFVRRGLPRREILSWVHFRPQANYIMSPTGNLMVDYVGRFETLEEDFNVVASRLGVKVDLRRTNSSTHAPFETVYSQETATIVGKIYESDATTFGYRAPG